LTQIKLLILHVYKILWKQKYCILPGTATFSELIKDWILNTY